MNVRRKSELVHEGRWAKYKYNLVSALGENGQRLTGCQKHIALSLSAAEEGMVLLENNGLLPLADGTRVALFGVGSVEYQKGGGGSGQVYPAYVKNLCEGFAAKAPRISLYEPLTAFYCDYCKENLETLGEDNILPEPVLPAELVENAAQHADVAVIVIHRYSAETLDRSEGKGDFYLTDEEEVLVQKVTSLFPHSVAVLNVGGMVDVSWIRENPKIDAALLAWQAGMEGGAAMANILCGDVNPSGRLTDTFAKSFADYPSAEHFNDSEDYVEYYEDIFVGYRYFETIPGAKDKVIYPFGYGLSYTEFTISKPVAVLVGDEIQVSLTVKNVGTRAGKEVVQVYYSAPQGRLGKSAVELAGFQKTQLLAPGAAEDICICFSVADMASYDDLGKCQMSAYILEQGEYRFFAGRNCHDLIECEYRYQVEENFVVVRQLKRNCAPNAIGKRMLADGSFEALPSFPIQEHTPETWVNPEAVPQGEEVHSFKEVAEGTLSLNAFVSQFTEQELVRLVGGIPNRGLANTSGWGGVPRLGVPAVMTADGPAGLRLEPDCGIATTAWPCATLLACTWNPDILYKIGKAGAMECKENGLAIWLTPGLNIHRNPLCGRNFEYFSEDPLLSGKFSAAKVRGIQSTGTAACAKHLAANNKEVNRTHSDSRMSERALREIYLRGFEICVKEAQPRTVMTSYNIVNGVRACENRELIEGILRGEWGFKGMVSSDWFVPCQQEKCVLAGNDVRMPYGFPQKLSEALESGRILRGHLELCAKRILEMILTLE